MSKALIYYDKKNYEEEKQIFDKLIDEINLHKNKLDEAGYKIEIDDLKDIVDNTFINKVYQWQLRQIANNLGVDYDEIKTFEFRMKNDLFAKMANNKCKSLYVLNDCIHSIIQLSDKEYLNNDIISINDNKAEYTSNGIEELKKRFVYYTESDKQNDVLEAVKRLQAVKSELEKYGISIKSGIWILDKDNNDIIPSRFYSLFH